LDLQNGTGKGDSQGTHLFRRAYWIFDLDGTLTLPIHDFQAIRRELGIPLGEDILGWLGALPEEESGPLFERLDALEAELIPRVCAAPGATALLHELAERGKRLGVLTRNVLANAHRTLEAIGVDHLFSPGTVLGRNEAKPKPDPDGIHRLIRSWGATTEDTVIVGDFKYDLEAGRAAGVATVHVDREARFAWPEFTDHPAESLDLLLVELERSA